MPRIRSVFSPDGSGEDDVSRARDEDWQRKGRKGMVQHSINLILKHIGVLAKTLRETERRQVVAQTRFQAEEELRRKGEKKVYEEKARNEKIIRELNTASSSHARLINAARSNAFFSSCTEINHQ